MKAAEIPVKNHHKKLQNITGKDMKNFVPSQIGRGKNKMQKILHITALDQWYHERTGSEDRSNKHIHDNISNWL